MNERLSILALESDIPEDGSGGAAGYGILIVEAILIVATKHGGDI